MRLGLIGATGHWQTYAPALGRVPGLELVAIAAAGPEETTGAFDHAPGQTMDTRRYDDARRMLDAERLDVVQVCARCDRIPTWTRLCLERGLPVMAEKPLAMLIFDSCALVFDVSPLVMGRGSHRNGNPGATPPSNAP